MGRDVFLKELYYPEVPFEYIISMGHFCSVAQELERLGLRDSSYPFDWVISPWGGVWLNLLNNFEGYVSCADLERDKNQPFHFKDRNTGIAFFHDFNQSLSLGTQIKGVEQKYSRRIERFKEAVQEPTLFVRYVQDDEELGQIEADCDLISEKILGFNEQNRILLIGNDTLRESQFVLFSFPVDKGDSVARTFAEGESGAVLRGYLTSPLLYDAEKRAVNVSHLQRKKQASQWSALRVKLRQAVLLRAWRVWVFFGGR